MRNNRTLHFFASAFAVLLASISPSFAQDLICDEAAKSDIRLNSVVTHLASGRYKTFVKESNRLVGLDPKEGNKFAETLESAFPGGFERCTLMLSDIHNPGFLREVVVLKSHKGEFVFLGYIAAKIDGEWDMWTYRVSTDLSEIMTAVSM